MRHFIWLEKFSRTGEQNRKKQGTKNIGAGWHQHYFGIDDLRDSITDTGIDPESLVHL